jgi:hypothetical protein
LAYADDATIGEPEQGVEHADGRPLVPLRLEEHADCFELGCVLLSCLTIHVARDQPRFDALFL